MDRRGFLKGTLLAGAAGAMAPLVQACAHMPVKPDGSPEPLSVESMMKDGARTMWIAAHPDDECFPGSLLAKSSIVHGNPLAFLVFTHGDGGECCLPEGCHPDLRTVRGGELGHVAEMYHAELQLESYFNAPLPVESFPKRHELAEIWRKQADPLPLAAKAIRKFRPDLLVTFEPKHGATGHPEHQLASRIATAAVRMAADPTVELEGLPPHRTTRTYYMLNRYWVFVMFGLADPGPVTEEFDATQPCTGSMTCQDFMCEATKFHRTQDNDMGNVRYFRSAFQTLWLRQTDPFTEIHPIDEKALKGGMG